MSRLSSTRQEIYNSPWKKYLSIFRRLISFCMWNITYSSLLLSQCSQVSSFQNWPSLEILYSVSSFTKQRVITTNIYYSNTEMFISFKIVQLQNRLLFSSYYCLFILWHIWTMTLLKLTRISIFFNVDICHSF